jgi:hypothetical protein
MRPKAKKSKKTAELSLKRVVRHLVGEHLESFCVIGDRLDGAPFILLQAKNHKDVISINAILATVCSDGGLDLQDAKH